MIFMGFIKRIASLEYDLNSFKKIAKDHFKTKITLNELVISLLSATLKRLDKQSRDVAIFIPLGKTKIEDTFQKISDNNLNNNAVGAHIKLPLIDHLDSNSIKMMQKLLYSQIVSQKFIIQAVVNSVNALNSIIPLQFTKMLMKQATKDLDLLFSNLPGPQEPIFINGCKVERIVPFASTGVQKCFITLYSYNGKINLISNFDEGQNIDPEEFKRCFNEVFEETLNNKLTIIEN